MTTTATKPQTRNWTFTETTIAGGKVDRENHRIKGVKVCGLKSVNGRDYTEQALKAGASLYESATVYINHEKEKPARNYQDRFGRIVDAKFVSGATPEQTGVFADVDYNPKHALAEQILHDAENNVEGVGLSHVVVCAGRTDGMREIVEQISKVKSVDIVPDPATVKTFMEQAERKTVREIVGDVVFEAMGGDPAIGGTLVDKPAAGGSEAEIKAAFRAAMIAAIDDESLDMPATMAKLKAIYAGMEKANNAGKKPEGDDAEKDKEPPADDKAEQAIRRLAAHEVLASFGIAPKPELVKELTEQADEAAMAAAVKAWPGAKRGAAKPPIQTKSVAEQTKAPSTYGEFKAAILGR